MAFGPARSEGACRPPHFVPTGRASVYVTATLMLWTECPSFRFAMRTAWFVATVRRTVLSTLPSAAISFTRIVAVLAGPLTRTTTNRPVLRATIRADNTYASLTVWVTVGTVAAVGAEVLAVVAVDAVEAAGAGVPLVPPVLPLEVDAAVVVVVVVVGAD